MRAKVIVGEKTPVPVQVGDEKKIVACGTFGCGREATEFLFGSGLPVGGAWYCWVCSDLLLQGEDCGL